MATARELLTRVIECPPERPGSDGRRVVHQAVDQRGDDHRVAEDFAPGLEPASAAKSLASDSVAPAPQDDDAGGPMSRYAVAHLDEIDEVSDGRCPSRPVRYHFGITSFGVNAWIGREAGDRIINEHDEAEEEDGQEELYLVQHGRATFELDGERVEAPAGTLVFARPGVKRTAFAEEPGTTIIALGGSPGKAYEPAGFEIWAPLAPLYQAGEYAEAADRGRELIKAHPEYPGLLYNVACCESLGARTADAIQHLRLAIERSDRFRSLAANDSDFDPIRDDPAFKQLVG
jgi:hypothetical protein